jgi:hypothetical protein
MDRVRSGKGQHLISWKSQRERESEMETNLFGIEVLRSVSWHVLGEAIADETALYCSLYDRFQRVRGMFAELARVGVQTDGHGLGNAGADVVAVNNKQ